MHRPALLRAGNLEVESYPYVVMGLFPWKPKHTEDEVWKIAGKMASQRIRAKKKKREKTGKKICLAGSGKSLTYRETGEQKKQISDVQIPHARSGSSLCESNVPEHVLGCRRIKSGFQPFLIGLSATVSPFGPTGTFCLPWHRWNR